MAKPTATFRQPAAASNIRSPLTGNGIQDELEFFFGEVATLAKQLKAAARTLHRDHNLPAGGRSVLQSLEHEGPQSVPQLARARAASRQHVQVLVDRLAAAGHVQFMPNPAHKRSDLAQLTERGKDMLGTAIEREAQFLAPLLPHISEAELALAAALVQRLGAALAGQACEASAGGAVAKPRTPVRRKKNQTPKVRKPVVQVMVQSTLADAPPAAATSEVDGLPVNLL